MIPVKKVTGWKQIKEEEKHILSFPWDGGSGSG